MHSPVLIRNDVLCSYLPTYKLTDGHVLDAFPPGEEGKGGGDFIKHFEAD